MLYPQEKEWETEQQLQGHQPWKRTALWLRSRRPSRVCVPIMPLFRSRVLIPLFALCLTTFLFWSVDRYDRATLNKLTKPLHQLSSPSSPSSSKSQESLPDPEALNKFCNPGDAAVLPYPPLSFSEWLIRKNYTRVYMRPQLVDAETTTINSLETIEQRVLPEYRTLDRGLGVPRGGSSDPAPCPPIIDVNIAADDPVDATAQILFGLATTVDRLRQQLPALLYSFGHTKASLLVLVPGDTPDIASHEKYFRERGLDVTLKPSPLDFTARYFGLVEAFTEHIEKVRPKTSWVSFIDDDTFFLSLARVAKHLAALDSTKKHYIGAFSEASWQVHTFGRIGFGGAGVFVSKPLLSVLHAVYRQCHDTGEQPGDQKLGQCISKYAGVELTQWKSLFQMDIKGAPDGVFESGRPIDTLHHWSSWYTKDVVKMSTVSAAAGRNSILRRWKFDEKVETLKDGSEIRSFWVLTNGYSLVKYSMDAKMARNTLNFDATEKTWEEDPNGYIERLGPLRPVDQPGVRKDRWMLLDSVVVGNNVHQLYTHEMIDAHSVIEVVWLPANFNLPPKSGEPKPNPEQQPKPEQPKPDQPKSAQQNPSSAQPNPNPSPSS